MKVKLLDDEFELVKMGDLEVPILDSISQDDPSFINHTMRISKLKKQFRGGATAVNELSLSIFKNQILALLGHNGAGKTTTMSMIAGFEFPTSGSINAFSLDMQEHRDTADKITGICP